MHLPHTRGDEPKVLAEMPLELFICPTRVGMNRGPTTQGHYFAAHLPHTRGDEPSALQYRGSTVTDLPHTRGDEPPQFI